MSDSHTPAHSAESDPRRALRALIDRGEGTSAAATMLRMMWLRREHPEAHLTTEAVEIEDDMVVIRAQITLGNGAGGSGIAAEHLANTQDWAAAVERTETNAIARALDTLGYVLEASAVREPAPMPAPARQPSTEPARPQLVPRPEPQPEPLPTTQVSTPPAEPEPIHTPGAGPSEPREAAPPPIVDALRRANRRPAEAPAPATPAPPPAADDEDHLEDYSWTAFWTRARELDLDKAAIEQRLGRPTQGMTPLQLRQALEETGIDFSGSSGQ